MRTNVSPGTELSIAGTAELTAEFAQLIATIGLHRKNVLLTYDGLRAAVGRFLEHEGCDVLYDVSFEGRSRLDENVVFDILAKKKGDTYAITVQNAITSRTLGQVTGYAKTLLGTTGKPKLYVATDILGYSQLTQGVIGAMVKDLMEREDVGVMLVDDSWFLTCDNHGQLTFVQMPGVLSSKK